MTWRKTGSEFDGECAHVDLSDAAYRTHQEAIGHIYDVSAMDCTFAKKRVRNFAHSDDVDAAVRELVGHGFWVDEGTVYRVVHHDDVIKASLVAQERTRVRTKKSSAAYRKKQSTDTPDDPDVTGHVTDNADRQTDRHLGGRDMTTCRHGIPNGTTAEPWASEHGELVCSDCTRERKGA